MTLVLHCVNLLVPWPAIPGKKFACINTRGNKLMLEVYLGQFEEIWPTKTFFYKSLETHPGSGNLISAGIAVTQDVEITLKIQKFSDHKEMFGKYGCQRRLEAESG